MRRILSVVVFALCASAAPRLARAACGDGIVQAGEQCDPASPNGELACPGRCVPLPHLDACQCTAPSSDPRDFAAIADFQARLAASAAVSKGGVAVTTTGGLLSLGAGAVIASHDQAIGDRCRLVPGSAVGRLFCNDAVVLPGAIVSDGGPFAFTPPLTFPALPPFTPGAGGGTDVDVPAKSTEYLAPGTYGNLIVEKGGTLVLHGLDPNSAVGRYDVLGVKVIDGGALQADNPVLVNVKAAFRLTGSASFGPTPLSSVQAGDLQVNVEGRGAKLGKGAFVQAHVRAPNGKITVGRGSIVLGQLIAQKIVIQKEGVLHQAGGCGDGEREVTETCDVTAPNGDQICPGQCIGLGQPGQCTCRCTTDADCNDGNACNGVETCTQGHCALGAPPNCNDNNPCTTDCNPATGCIQVNVSDGTPCDDGDECTKSDVCMSGVCEAGGPRTCNDGNDCTTDSCDPTKGCLHEPIATGLPCSDGNACTQADACIRGNCIAGSPVSCDDLNPCTVDSCSPLIGCQHLPITDGVSCSGPSPCSSLDTCQAGVCVGRGGQLCSDGNECTSDACAPVGPIGAQTIQCSHTSAANFTPCGPGGTKSCFNGVCL
jgi:hypothetical protein